jgi:hypothetical protein
MSAYLCKSAYLSMSAMTSASTSLTSTLLFFFSSMSCSNMAETTTINNNSLFQSCSSGLGPGSALTLTAGSRPGSGRAKMTHKNVKKERFHLRAGCSILRAEGFVACTSFKRHLDKQNCNLIKKKEIYFFGCKITNFWSSNPYIRIRICFETNADLLYNTDYWQPF